MVNIRELRKATKMTQQQFAEYFGIPIGTLRNWEQEISKPPNYVFQMIFKSIRRDSMINIETVRFIKILDELALLSKNGIESFQCVKESTFRQKVFYDPQTIDEKKRCKIVLDACVAFDHRDIISYYDSVTFEYKIRVRLDGDPPFITVSFPTKEDDVGEEIIVIDNGSWHFV